MVIMGQVSWRTATTGVVAALLITACSGGSTERSVPRTPTPSRVPVTSSRAELLPDPPIPVYALTGSPDRLVVTNGNEDFRGQGPPSLQVAAFDFPAWRWTRLPNARWTPVALPDGLASVGLVCEPRNEEDELCHVDVATLRWGDEQWHQRRVTRRPLIVNEGGEVDPIGVRGRFAYFIAYRGDVRILRVSADGEVLTLPKPPAPNIDRPATPLCATPRGIETVDSHWADRDIALPGYGPLWRLDDRAAHPRWKRMPGTDPLDMPGANFDCGATGLVVFHAPQTSAFIGRDFVTIAAAGTTPIMQPRPYPCCIPLSGGGLAYHDGADIYRLRDGQWTKHVVHRGTGTDGLWSIVAVGDLVVYHAINQTTQRSELRVVP